MTPFHSSGHPLTLLRQQIVQLKFRYNASSPSASWCGQLERVRELIRQHHAGGVPLIKMPSLYAIPTQELSTRERVLHRIWLGGSPPWDVCETVLQWQDAIRVSQSQFHQVLWVWNTAQLAGDERFIQADRGTDWLFLGEVPVRVLSLEALAQQHCTGIITFLNHLHGHGYYATLSDFFRLLILIHHGGVYLDADTLPCRPATLFLQKPELPCYPGATGERIDWMNLFVDETGMIFARRDNATLCTMLQQLTAVYAAWPEPVRPRTPQHERALFEPFYAIWCAWLNRTQISHQRFSEDFALLGYDDAQLQPWGVKGMRLQSDIFSGEVQPLSPQEQEHYHQAVNALDKIAGVLADPLALAEHVSVFSRQCIPPLARAPQLRAEHPGYNYYGVLSDDASLDAMNGLFSRYLIAHNAQAIAGGQFWTVVQRNVPVQEELILKPGRLATDEEQRHMARLIFTTSYLEYCSVDNLSGLDVISLQQKQNITPYLQTTEIVTNMSGEFLGFVNAAPLKAWDDITVPCAYRDEVRALDEAYEGFVARHCREDDLFIASVAFTAQARGQRFFSKLLAILKQQALREGLKRITLCVWSSNTAVQCYTHKGFSVESVMSTEVTQRFRDTLLFMILPLVPDDAQES